MLRDFRAWLDEFLSGGCQPPESENTRGVSAPRSEGTVDLFTLVGQFTALRHEVNLQTKAARAAVEQTNEAIKLLATPQPATNGDDDPVRPLVKAVVDIADALALSFRQMEKLPDAVDELLDTAEPEDSPHPGFFARLFGARFAVPRPETRTATEKLRQLAAAAADGYALSLRRVERVLPTFGLEPVSCIGEAFDPELMEVVEVVGDTEQPPGTVIEEVRPGYRWRGKVFRFAQVKVAR